MANPEHVRVVKQGAKAIEEWRKRNRGVILDLSGADLARAELNHANLSHANLSEAFLLGANLSGANLTGAELSLARLFRAKLIGADLTGVDLVGAELSRANLSRVNLREATVGSTTFGQCDLSRARGLELVIHKLPNTIGVDTLIETYRKGGNRLTPAVETFFNQAGVPRELLEALPQIVGKIKYYTCFIAYGEPDKEFAEKLNDDLKAKGVPCWLFLTDAPPGKPLWPTIGKTRRESDKVIVTCSAPSLIRDGLLKEIEDTVDEDPSKLLPISLDNTWRAEGFPIKRGQRELKTYLTNQIYADFQGWKEDQAKYNSELEKLLTKGLRRQ